MKPDLNFISQNMTVPTPYELIIDAYNNREVELPFDKLIFEDQERKLNRLAEIFKAVSNTDRLRIIKLLEGGELSVGVLVSELSSSYASISRHLRYLQRARIVDSRRLGTAVCYSLYDDRILELINDTRP